MAGPSPSHGCFPCAVVVWSYRLCSEGLLDPPLTQHAVLIQQNLKTKGGLDVTPEAYSSPFAQPFCPELGAFLGSGGETSP